jgi:hypothetical protein
MSRAFVVLLWLALGLVTTAAVAQQQHWLAGTWKGEIKDHRGKDATRILNVVSVAPDGTVQGGWGITSAPVDGKDTISVSGDTVNVRTRAGSVVVLTRTGANGLRGSFQLQTAGKPQIVDLTKQP